MKALRILFFWYLVKHNFQFLVVTKFFSKKKSFAANKLDILIADILGKFENIKYYVEIGANNGIDQSNTKYLEVYENWRGLLIEPIPHVFKKLKRNRSKKNHFENVACVSYAHPGNTVKMIYADLMSVGLQSDNDLEDLDLHIKSSEVFLRKGDCFFELVVPAVPMSVILDRAGAPKIISFLSLDVEGSEIDVLKGIDFNDYTFKLILVESRSFEIMRQFLVEKEYIFCAKVSIHDYLFRHSSFSWGKQQTILEKYLLSQKQL